eukprot:CAMPEP_0118666464 /NCGR_PEP_ID=MMETSP0785-20121206/19229_1 /TAXON_ID=91992 /ORGANISM="Bolidomonas pacifica, Strain CCMP 1866" /LENGTH=269 /DNA_ID=CAMNT_0006560777 /DNA_START=99 /DNA_END=905 /DNA_ORIENTATION=+
MTSVSAATSLETPHDNRGPKLIIALTMDGTIHGMSPSSGHIVWSTPLKLPQTSPQTSSGGNDASSNDASNDASPIPLLSSQIFPSTSRIPHLIPSPTGQLYQFLPTHLSPFLPTSNLVSLTPYLSSGYVYEGYKTSEAVGVDWRNGRRRRGMGEDGGIVKYDNESEEVDEDDDEHIVWVGRNDFTVNVFSASTGVLEERVRTAQVMSNVENLASSSKRGKDGNGDNDTIRTLYTTSGGTLAMIEDEGDDITWINSQLPSQVVSAIDLEW